MNREYRPSGELSDLLSALADELLTGEQERRLADLLRQDAAVRDYYARYVSMLASLEWHGQAAEACGPPAEAPPVPRRSFRVGIVAAAVLLPGILAVWLLRPTAPAPIEPGPLATLRPSAGKVVVMRADGQARTEDGPVDLRHGDTVRTESAGSAAVVTYPDGTRLELGGPSAVTLTDAGRKSVTVHGGQLVARVAPQAADSPLALLTPRAEVHVLGTELALSAAADRTDLAVTAGTVRVTRVADRQSARVATGQFVVTRDDADLQVRNIPRPPQRWEEDFEKARPAGWVVGDRLEAGLPAGSRGAVRAARIERPDGVYQEISTPKAWADGLFAIGADSVFHMTFKVERPRWFQVFISTRPFDPDAPPTATYRFKDASLWSTDVGRWKTVSIPLTRFERVSDWSGVPPLGEVPFQVLLSSKDVDPGLVVDRLWVDRPPR